MDVIKFYKVSDKFGYLSNFARYPIFLDRFIWPTTEHYFQAMKFEDYDIQDKLRAIPKAIDVAQEGRSRKYILRNDWEDVKLSIMKRALYAKFTQHRFLAVELLKTNNKLIVEHTVNDSFWGDGGNGHGFNHLGLLLMEIRDEINSLTCEGKYFLPPWIAFPKVGIEDLFWRMGLGESYMDEWYSYYNGLGDKLDYRNQFTEPDSWIGIYE